MSYNLLASQVPVPVATPSPTQVGSATASSNAGAGSLGSFSPTVTSPLPFNQIEVELANAIGYGGNGIGVVTGLAISTSASLTAPISAGIGVANGFQYLLASGSCVCPPSQSNVFIWMNAGSTFQATTTTTPPTATSIFLGWCTTSGSAVTTVDFSGVCYVLGGMILRHTADLAMPTDSPNASPMFFTKCPAGLYFWDGAKYWQVPSSMCPSKYILGSKDQIVIPAGYQELLFGSLTVGTGATLTVAGNLRVIA